MTKKIDVPRLLFIFSVATLIFFYGLAVGMYRIFPYDQISFVKQSIIQVISDAGMITQQKPSRHLIAPPDGEDGSGVVRHQEALAEPGYTLVSSFFDDGLALRLLDPHGNTVNDWPIRFSEIWPDGGSHLRPVDRPNTDWNAISMGAVALPDGSVLLNALGLIKFDRCGEIEWKLTRATHHSIERSGDDAFWVPTVQHITEKSASRPFKPPYKIDTVLKVSSSGEVMQEIVVLDVLLKNNLQGLLLANNRYLNPSKERDIVHLNDIEELPAAFAASFPQFEAGDLMLSLRNLNLIVVIDPDTLEVKWHQTGPWVAQHDSDWQADGSITLVNNNTDGTLDGSLFGGSSIMRVDPKTGTTEILYGQSESEDFYTGSKGAHQLLQNGNLLIVESDRGRLFEVSPQREIVWQYINRYSDEQVFMIAGANRYPLDYFEVDSWACPR